MMFNWPKRYRENRTPTADSTSEADGGDGPVVPANRTAYVTASASIQVDPKERKRLYFLNPLLYNSENTNTQNRHLQIEPRPDVTLVGNARKNATKESRPVCAY